MVMNFLRTRCARGVQGISKPSSDTSGNIIVRNVEETSEKTNQPVVAVAEKKSGSCSCLPNKTAALTKPPQSPVN